MGLLQNCWHELRRSITVSFLFKDLRALQIMKAVTEGELPPRLDITPHNNDTWKLMHRCWVHNKRLRPCIRDVVKIMKSWERAHAFSPRAFSSRTSSISRRSDSISRGSTPYTSGPISGYNDSSSDSIPRSSPSEIEEKLTPYTTDGRFNIDRSEETSPSKKVEKSTPSNYLARAYRTIRRNKKRSKRT